MRLLQGIGRLFTAGPAGTVEDAAVAIDRGVITWVGPGASAPPCDGAIDLGGRLVTPGLIDGHTHPLYASPRLAEAAAVSRGGHLRAAGGGGRGDGRDRPADAGGGPRRAR